jgi:hypothetical protein
LATKQILFCGFLGETELGGGEEGRRGGHSKAQKLKRRILQHILDLPM